MSAPLFPSADQLMLILMSELPDSVYADDLADDPDVNKRSASSSEVRAHAIYFANLYDNLEQIYLDKFASTVTPDGLAYWEKDFFSAIQDSSLGYTARQQNLLAKKRATGGISLPIIQSIVSGILTPVGLTFAILPYSGQNNGANFGAWILGLSSLDIDTFLALEDPLKGTGLNPGQTPLDCSLNYAAAGLTAQDLENIQFTAYAYEVQIYGTANAATLTLLDNTLTALEPARSTHILRNNAVAGPISPIDVAAYIAATPQFNELRI